MATVYNLVPFLSILRLESFNGLILSCEMICAINKGELQLTLFQASFSFI